MDGADCSCSSCFASPACALVEEAEAVGATPAVVAATMAGVTTEEGGAMEVEEEEEGLTPLPSI